MLTPVHVLDTVVCKPKRVTTEVQVPHYEGRNMVGRKKSGLKLLECRQADCRSPVGAVVNVHNAYAIVIK